jgi:hypothetical protein
MSTQPPAVLTACANCGRASCQCVLCAKAKGHSGLCAECYRKQEKEAAKK